MVELRTTGLVETFPDRCDRVVRIRHSTSPIPRGAT